MNLRSEIIGYVCFSRVMEESPKVTKYWTLGAVRSLGNQKNRNRLFVDPNLPLDLMSVNKMKKCFEMSCCKLFFLLLFLLSCNWSNILISTSCDY